MDRLRQLQSDFRGYLLRPDTAMLRHVSGSAQAQKRLAIYANAYRARLIEALDANYPALHRWLGDEEFRRLGSAYLDEHPSQHYSIRWFGHCLPGFVAHTPPWCDNVMTNELTRFEWAMSEAFDAADDAVVTVEQIAAVPADAWPGLTLAFHASLHRLLLTSNAPAVWRALTRDEAPTPEQAESPIAWLIWRQGLTQYYRSLDVDEAWALDAARDGKSFADICQGVCEWIDPEHVAARVAGSLRQWTDDGLIIRLSV